MNVWKSRFPKRDNRGGMLMQHSGSNESSPELRLQCQPFLDKYAMCWSEETDVKISYNRFCWTFRSDDSFKTHQPPPNKPASQISCHKYLAHQMSWMWFSWSPSFEIVEPVFRPRHPDLLINRLVIRFVRFNMF